MTYYEWIENLTDKQKEIFDKTRCNVQNQSSCKKQYARYTEVWGKENVPKTFDEFPNIKYNYTDQSDDLKYYERNINGRPIEYVMIYRELEKAGIKNKRKAYPAEDIEITAGEFNQKTELLNMKLVKIQF